MGQTTRNTLASTVWRESGQQGRSVCGYWLIGVVIEMIGVVTE